MATPETHTSVLKPTFASVAARAPCSGPTITAREAGMMPKSRGASAAKPPKQSVLKDTSIAQVQQDIHNSMSKLEVKDTPVSSGSLNEQAKSNIKRAGLRLDDENTHVSCSTNGNSLDGKSTASATTFAFDEKESLRPDDSASVQAADDDDGASAAMSGAPNSRIGSEAGSRAFRDQFNEVSQHAPAGNTRLHPLSQGINAPTTVEDPQRQDVPNPTAAPAQAMAHPDAAVIPRIQMPFADAQPDKKLFEALESPKDRMFLLRLEQDIIDFVRNSRDAKIQLPPCNSFCRLLAHKMADYYGLTHFFDNTQNAVNLFRTPYCQLRTPLCHLARNLGQDVTAITSAPAPAMKIMRRPSLSKQGQAHSSDAPTTESSIVPSKAGSEAGDENQQGTGAVSPTESALTKDKTAMSRAEREARYKEKREEIFGPPNENADSNEASNEVSRVSSRNEEKKRKKKNRIDNDDFEVRSQFNAYYPTIAYPTQPYMQATNPPGYLVPYNFQPHMQQHAEPNQYYSAVVQSGFVHATHGPTPNQGFQLIDPQNQPAAGFGGHAAFQGYGQQPPTQYIAFMPPPMIMSQPSPSISSPSLDGYCIPPHTLGQNADMQTPRSAFSQPYHSQDNQQRQFSEANMPYHFAQMPFQVNAPNGQTANSMSSPFTRPQVFNPQTRSFVPNGTAHVNPNNHQVTSPLASSNVTPAKAVSNGGQFSPSPLFHTPPNSIQNENFRGGARKPPTHSNGSGSPIPSSLSKWGTPANLPPKPPPPEAPSMPESLPVNNQFTAKPQPLTSGQPMPHYYNGVYSMPRP